MVLKQNLLEFRLLGFQILVLLLLVVLLFLEAFALEAIALEAFHLVAFHLEAILLVVQPLGAVLFLPEEDLDLLFPTLEPIAANLIRIVHQCLAVSSNSYRTLRFLVVNRLFFFVPLYNDLLTQDL